MPLQRMTMSEVETLLDEMEAEITQRNKDGDWHSKEHNILLSEYSYLHEYYLKMSM